MEKFTFSVTEVSYGTYTVYADSEEQARQQIESGVECFDVHNSEITSIERI